VGTVDIRTLPVQLAPTLDVQAKLKFEGPPPYPVEVPVRLSPLQTAHPDDTGSYAWSGVIPGTYNLAVDLPDGFYMKSSTTVDISRGRQGPFELVASAGAAGLDGKVQFPDSVDKVRVILIGSRIEKTALTNADGVFILKGIAPGQYTLTAVEEDEDQNWRNPDILKSLAAKGVPVELARGVTGHRDLALTR
jgi:protocatechuate 3,4-dioxygenase beta subunit